MDSISEVTDSRYSTAGHRDVFESQTRRDFIRNLTMSGLGMMGFGAFLQSCGEKKVMLTTDLAKAYIEGLLGIINTIKEREFDKIHEAAALAIQSRLQGYKLFANITGGMLPSDIDKNRPGSPDLFLTEDLSRASRYDVIITNNPEVVRGFGERWVKVIGITSPDTVNQNTPPETLENMGTLRIEDVADIIIYSHVPYTDGIVNVKGIDIPICPASGAIQTFIYYVIVAEITEGLTKSGIYPQIG